MTVFARPAVVSGMFVAALAGVSMGCASGSSSDGEKVQKVPEAELFLLPPGFRGPFIAIYGQGGGILPEWRGDTAVYRVPERGMLKITHPEPPRSTRVSHVFADRLHARLRNYPTCADMRVHVTDTLPHVCWLDYSVGGTGKPDHIVALITDWSAIPQHYNRAGFLLDSLGFGRWSPRSSPWSEPRDLRRHPPRAGAE